jgi:virginiamycin B lyase
MKVIGISEWNAEQLAVYNPTTGEWKEWRLLGDNPMPYAAYVDKKDIVWLSDFGATGLMRFNPTDEMVKVFFPFDVLRLT